MNYERFDVSVVALEILGQEGWNEGEDGHGLWKYNATGDRRYEYYSINMTESDLEETQISLQAMDEKGGWVDVIKLIVEREKTEIRMRLLFETCRADGESWMPTFEFDEAGNRKMVDGRAMSSGWSVARERMLRGLLFNRFSMPTKIDFERSLAAFLTTMQSSEFDRPIVFRV